MLHYLAQNLIGAVCDAFVSWFFVVLYKAARQEEFPLIKMIRSFFVFFALASSLVGLVCFRQAYITAEGLAGLWAYGDYFLETRTCTVIGLVQRDLGPAHLYCQDGSRYLWVYGERETVVTRWMIDQTPVLTIRYFPTTNMVVSLNQSQDQEQEAQEINLSSRRVALYFLVRYAPPILLFAVFCWFFDDILDRVLHRVSPQRRRVVSLSLVVGLGIVIGFLSYPFLVVDSIAAIILGDSYPKQETCQVIASDLGGEHLRCSEGVFWLLYPNRLQSLAFQIANSPKLTVKYFPLSGFVLGLSVSQ